MGVERFFFRVRRTGGILGSRKYVVKVRECVGAGRGEIRWRVGGIGFKLVRLRLIWGLICRSYEGRGVL